MAMFSKGAEASVTRPQSLIQEGMSVRGDMKAEGDVRLDGSLEGALVSKSRLIIGGTGVIRADLEAAEVLVMGRVKGKIVGHRRVELRKGAHVEGDISTQALVIEEGVFFQGLCQMASQGQPLSSHAASPGGITHPAGQTSGAHAAAQTTATAPSRESRAVQAGTETPKPYNQDLYSGTTTKSSS